MYKLCKTEQSANRQRELEQGLLAAMAVSHYDQISISDLCDRLQIPRKSFYRYFSGKDGALQALIDHTLVQFETRNVFLTGGKEQALRQELEQFFRFWREQKPLLDALARSGLSGMLIARAIDHALEEAGYPRQAPLQPVLGQQENAIMFAICGLMTMMVHWHHSGYEVTAQQMASVAARVLTRPLFKEL